MAEIFLCLATKRMQMTTSGLLSSLSLLPQSHMDLSCVQTRDDPLVRIAMADQCIPAMQNVGSAMLYLPATKHPGARARSIAAISEGQRLLQLWAVMEPAIGIAP